MLICSIERMHLNPFRRLYKQYMGIPDNADRKWKNPDQLRSKFEFEYIIV